ncbi:MAG: asparagine synthetase B family protein, partial [Polyangiaceae bacterium]
MCGIAGYVQASPEARILGEMLDRLSHRGPDGEGAWQGTSGEWQIALGHRRLSILDLSGGAQPMSAADGSVKLTYNGELYNFRELRKALETRGVICRTRSDTEVLSHHVAAHWTAGLDSLSGMFAFALWDRGRRTLLLARDRAGIKPLYYARLPGGGIAFASELTALLQHTGVRREMSPGGLQSYFFSDYFHPPTTLIEGVLKLPPGHFVEWTDGRMSEPALYVRRPLGSADRPRVMKPGVLARDLWTRLGHAVESQLVADVPVGAFVSGGLDSSCVATLAQERVSGRL